MIIDKNQEITHCQLCIGEDDNGVLLLWDDSWEMVDVDSNPKNRFLSELIPLMFYKADKSWFQDDYRAYHTGAIATPIGDQTENQKDHFMLLANQESVNFCTKHWISDGGG